MNKSRLVSLTAHAMSLIQVLCCPPGYLSPECTRTCKPGSYGPSCASNCSPGCTDSVCDHKTGSCFSCRAGFTGNRCVSNCPRGRHGNGCMQECPAGCEARACHPRTGYCGSCVPGYRGRHCDIIVDQSLSSPGKEWTPPIWLVAALGLVLPGVAVQLCVWLVNQVRAAREKTAGRQNIIRTQPATNTRRYQHFSFLKQDNVRRQLEISSAKEKAFGFLKRLREVITKNTKRNGLDSIVRNSSPTVTNKSISATRGSDVEEITPRIESQDCFSSSTVFDNEISMKEKSESTNHRKVEKINSNINTCFKTYRRHNGNGNKPSSSSFASHSDNGNENKGVHDSNENMKALSLGRNSGNFGAHQTILHDQQDLYKNKRKKFPKTDVHSFEVKGNVDIIKNSFMIDRGASGDFVERLSSTNKTNMYNSNSIPLDSESKECKSRGTIAENADVIEEKGKPEEFKTLHSRSPEKIQLTLKRQLQKYENNLHRSASENVHTHKKCDSQRAQKSDLNLTKGNKRVRNIMHNKCSSLSSKNDTLLNQKEIKSVKIPSSENGET